MNISNNVYSAVFASGLPLGSLLSKLKTLERLFRKNGILVSTLSTFSGPFYIVTWYASVLSFLIDFTY